MDLYVYIDESGTIPKSQINIDENSCFVLGIVITTAPIKIQRKFREGIVDLTTRFERYKNELKLTGEIKGNNVKEREKAIIFKHVYNKHPDKWEIGIVRLYNKFVHERFRENSARAFNYLVWTFLHYYLNHSKLVAGSVKNVFLVIDERNVASNARYELEGYLQMKNFESSENNHCQPLFEKVFVKYVDSSTESLVQMSDMIANSYWRWFSHGESGTKPRTIEMFETKLVNECCFDYPRYRE